MNRTLTHLIVATLVALGARDSRAHDESRGDAGALLAAARSAGTEASPLVFERDAEADAEDRTDGGISGRTLLLATAIASAAVVTAAWLLRGGCEPADTIFVELRQARPAFLSDGTAVAALPLPSYPLPALCQPRR